MLISSKVSRIAQLALAVAMTVLGGIVLRQGGSIQETVAQLNELTGHQFNVTTSNTAAVSVSSGALTLFDKTGLYTSTAYSKTRRFYKRKYSVASVGGLPIGVASYLSAIVGSELGENLLWFSNMAVNMAKHGDGSCSNTAGLLKQYNLTSNLAGELESFYSWNVEKGLVSREVGNSSIGSKQSELILKLSSNCQLNKGIIATSVLAFYLYVITSGMVVNLVIKFIEQFQAAGRMVELKYDDPFAMPQVSLVDLIGSGDSESNSGGKGSENGKWNEDGNESGSRGSLHEQQQV